jgi:hypothetical protein
MWFYTSTHYYLWMRIAHGFDIESTKRTELKNIESTKRTALHMYFLCKLDVYPVGKGK